MRPTNPGFEALLLQSSGPGVNRYQLMLAVFILAAGLVLLAIGMWRTQYVGLSESAARQKSTLKSEYEAQTPTSLRLPIDVDFQAHRGQFRSLWSDDPQLEEPTTMREALGSVHRSFLESWRSLTDRVPTFAVRLVEEGAAILILGALAVMSVEQWERIFATGGGRPDAGTITDAITGLTATVADAGFTVLGLFPYGDMVWALALGYGMLGYQLLYTHWLPLGILLILGGVVLVALDRLTPSIDAGLHLRDRALGYWLVVAVATVWTAGVVPVVVGSTVGFEAVGAIVGFLAALAVAAYMAYRGALAAYEHFRFATLDRDTDDDLESYLLAAYLGTCRAYAIVAAVAATLIPVYLGVILLEGRLFDVWSAFAAGSTDMQAVVALLVALVVVVLAYEVRDAWPDLRASLSHTLSSHSVRLALFGRAMPVGVVIATAMVSFGMFESVVLAAIAALSAGIGARVGYLLLMRARYKMGLYEPPEQKPRRVLIEAYTLADADGTERYVATINRERIARDDVDSLVDELVEHAESLADDGEYATTFGRHYAEHLFEYGIVGEERSRKKLRERVRKTAYAPLLRQDNHARVEDHELEDDLEKYPDEIVDERLRTFQVKGTRHGRITQRDGYYVLER